MTWKGRGIQVHILGDAPPFSKLGRSSSYRVTVGGRTFLVDCGAPIFRLLSAAEIGELEGVIATHSHADHRRWLADLALFRFYVLGDRPRLKLFSTEEIHAEYAEASRALIERTLSAASDRIVSQPYDEFFECLSLGPRPKYRIARAPGGDDSFAVVDAAGNELGPDRAKVVLGPGAVRPRLLFKDPEEGAWVEPQVYYSQRDPRFYEDDEHAYVDAGDGFSLRACRDHCWHGPPTIGVLIESGEERVMFGADTVFHPELWRRMVEERPSPTHGALTRAAFERAPVIRGDINQFIERVWSPERYESAVRAYGGTVVLQDTAAVRSIVHTDYMHIKTIKELSSPERILCVHTPDHFASTEPLSFAGKVYRVLRNEIYEEVGGQLHPLDAAIYMKDGGNSYAGYEDAEGAWAVVEGAGQLIDVVPVRPGGDYDGKLLFRCRLLADLRGSYYPRLSDPDESYRLRADGKVERVRTAAGGSTGEVVSAVPRPVLAPGALSDIP